MTDLSTALALAMVIEGMFYALFPEAMRRRTQIAALPPQALRLAGLLAACLGVGAVWLILALSASMACRRFSSPGLNCDYRSYNAASRRSCPGDRS